ncbi:MAG TPA: bifunctional aspartate kinase/homoserine dehydrogenase I [Vicinamibacterales bacterium]|nr:bifunctional aspartate kinase/homoserine dehydrogenase I [Vicinamibacterales bacterium]
MSNSWRVFKFGGSSVADAACMRRVAEIIEAEPAGPLAVVLSAAKGVTDGLLDLVSAAERQEPTAAALAALRQRHIAIATEICTPDDVKAFAAEFDADAIDIEQRLRKTAESGSSSHETRDVVSGYGELWSSRLFARCLQSRGRRGTVRWLDARDVVQVQWGPLGPAVQWPVSRQQAAALVPAGSNGTLIVPGFIARTPDGVQTTLGRNGSDFSASIFGDVLNASEIHIWTDVDGVLSADPRRVPDATVIDSLSYHEAMELAYFGAKVIHPQTMAPAVTKGIPIWVRNTFAARNPGTLICAKPESTHAVKGITSIDAVALVNVEGAGMIGVPGTAQRLFGALREDGISVILISQGSSEHSICFAVPEKDAEHTAETVRRAFAKELHDGQIQDVEALTGHSILSVVGDGMAGTPGIAADVFGALAGAGVNVRAIAQGSSERNISVVIDGKQTTRALRSVHARFYLSPHTISIGLVGPGVVGSVLLEQIASQAPRLLRDFRLDLRVRALMTSKKMILSDQPIGLDGWRDKLAKGEPVDLEKFEDHVHADHLPHAVIIDCSASEKVAALYPRWLGEGIHVVTPNKRANSGPLELFRKVQSSRRAGGSHYLYEATVGAGLPIMQTLRDLRETGDEIRKVEGILSGTLAYLFNVWDGSESFSSVVKAAKAKGYTEPDPRDDLSGTDVARKLVILAREMGMRLELSDVALEGLIPPQLVGVGVEEFMARLGELDAPMLARLEAARSRNRVLRYVGALDAASNKATVGLVELERSHPFANINLTDNVVRFVTSRYDQNPLVVQGPGAGPAVTAGGVFADLLRVCSYLGAKI